MRITLPRSIRARLTLAGTAVLLVGLVLAAVAFDRLLEHRLTANLDQTLQTQATDRAAAIDDGVDPTTLLDGAQRETAVAAFDQGGTLLDQRGFSDPGQVADLAGGTNTTMGIDLFEAHENETERYDLRVVVAQPGATRVVVAAELEGVQQTLGDARRLLALGIPIVALAGAGLLWLLTSRALRPVEALRSDAQAIADIGAGGRVQQPPSRDEIGALADTLNDMLERLDASADGLRRFVSDASHEIRSPAANIRARMETADHGDWEQARNDVVGEVERIEAIVDDLTFPGAQ